MLAELEVVGQVLPRVLVVEDVEAGLLRFSGLRRTLVRGVRPSALENVRQAPALPTRSRWGRSSCGAGEKRCIIKR